MLLLIRLLDTINVKNYRRLLVVFICVGCSPSNQPEIPESVSQLENLSVYAPDERPAAAIHLEREQVFRDTEEVPIGRVGEVTVDQEGQLYIADPTQNTILVFDPDGNYLASIGREGSGPGEFRGPGTMDVFSNQLYVYDVMQHRVNVFDLNTRSVSHTVNFGSSAQEVRSIEDGLYSPREIFFRNDQMFLMSFGSLLHTTPPERAGQVIDHYRKPYYLIDRDGRRVSDKLFEQKDYVFLTASVNGRIRTASGFPFIGKSLIAVAEDGTSYTTWSEDFLITVRAPDGTYLRAIYYPYEKVNLTRDAAVQGQERDIHKQFVLQNELPETFTALNEILIDDENRLWVSTIIEDDNVYEWWVLQESGELITRFTWPKVHTIALIRNGFMYTRETDERTGIQSIVRYRIDLQEY